MDHDPNPPAVKTDLIQIDEVRKGMSWCEPIICTPEQLRAAAKVTARSADAVWKHFAQSL